tara:strand:+ start:3021 stop:3578 length:558 start_codon:yes stop_codon:yes gene_type:complete
MANDIVKSEGAKNELVTSKEIVKAYQPMEMMRTHSHLKTVEDVVKNKGTALSGLSNTVGKDSLHALIEIHIWNLNSTMNLQNKLNEAQVMEIAVEIISMYYYLTMEDIYLIFRKAKRGEFGKVYGSLSMIDIFEWFTKYDNERTRVYVSESTKHKHNDSTTRTSEKNAKAHHIEQLIDFKNANNL